MVDGRGRGRGRGRGSVDGEPATSGRGRSAYKHLTARARRGRAAAAGGSSSSSVTQSPGGAQARQQRSPLSARQAKLALAAPLRLRSARAHTLRRCAACVRAAARRVCGDAGPRCRRRAGGQRLPGAGPAISPGAGPEPVTAAAGARPLHHSTSTAPRNAEPQAPGQGRRLPVRACPSAARGPEGQVLLGRSSWAPTGAVQRRKPRAGAAEIERVLSQRARAQSGAGQRGVQACSRPALPPAGCRQCSAACCTSSPAAALERPSVLARSSAAA
jgi:hypothetical protein